MKDYALSGRNRAVTAKKCTKKFDVLAKFFLHPLLFWRPQRGFPNIILRKVNIHEH